MRNELKKIEDFIDNYDKDITQQKPRKRNRLTRLRGLPILSIVFVIGMLVTASTLFSILVTDTTTIETTFPITFNDQPAGELTTSQTITGVAGETISKTAYLNYSDSNNGAYNITFDFNSSSTVLDDDGIVITMDLGGDYTAYNWDYENEILSIEPNENIVITVYYALDQMLKPADYDIDMSLSVL